MFPEYVYVAQFFIHDLFENEDYLNEITALREASPQLSLIRYDYAKAVRDIKREAAQEFAEYDGNDELAWQEGPWTPAKGDDLGHQVICGLVWKTVAVTVVIQERPVS